jgi:alcohol dehydrogenase
MRTAVANWQFEHPTRILFGEGRLTELPDLVTTPDVLLITTPGSTRRGISSRLQKLLAAHQVTVVDTVEANPTLESIERATTHLAGNFHGTIIGLGGGSAVDTAKVLSVTLPGVGEGFSIRAYFGGNTGLPSASALPVIAIPTTAGTGSEVTPFATVWNLENGAKYSLATPALFPRVALLDPQLTLEVPRAITIATGLDAISQAFESIWNKRCNPITIGFALRALELALPGLAALLDSPLDLSLRARMMEASLLAGLAISHTRTALAHSMSYPLTARYLLPHGLACSFMLPAVLDFNEDVDDGRLVQVARQVGCDSVGDLRAVLVRLLLKVEMNEMLCGHGITRERITQVIPEMITPGRADNNLRPVDLNDVAAIVTATGEYLPSLRAGGTA